MSDASWATGFVAWTLTYLVHSTIFIAVAWAVARFSIRHPEVTCGVWKVALVGGIVTASIQLGFGLSPLGGSVALPAATAPVVERSHAPEPLAVTLGDPQPVAVPSQVGLLAVSNLDALERGAAAPTPAPAGPPPWAIALAWLALLGGGLGALSVLRAAIGLRRQLATRAPAPPPMREILHELMARARCARAVGLSVDPRTSMPLATGVLRPEIVLPARVHSLDAEHQRPILAHELAHVVRRDPAWRLVSLLIERVLFFQPLNRVASDRMAACAELASDDWAARHTDEPLALARCLTEVASWLLPATGGSPRGALVSPMAASSQLRDRVLRLLDPHRPVAPRRGLGIAAAVLLAGVALAAPGVSTGEPPRVSAVKASADAGPPLIDDSMPFVDPELPESVAMVWAVSADANVEPEAPSTEVAAPSKRERRKAKRRVAKANRKASRELQAAMRDARRQGRVAPSQAEIERIVAKAQLEAGRAQANDRRASASSDAELERFELRIELPEGSLHLGVRGTPGERTRRHHPRRAHHPPRPPGHRARPAPPPFAHGKPHSRRSRNHPRPHHTEGLERARRELQRQLERDELPPEVHEHMKRQLERVDRQLERAGERGLRPIDAPLDPAAPASPGAPPAPAPPPPPAKGRQWVL
jgi:beta-lactamase regulating signal transducer with metallopeptidase domain